MLGREPLATHSARITLHSGTGSLTLDARRLDFVSPVDTAGLVAIAHSPAASGLPISLVLPDDRDVRAYFEQSGVLDALPERVSIVGRGTRNPSRRFPLERMMGVRLLTTATADSVTGEFGELVASQYPFKSGRYMSGACNELLANAEEHGVCEPGAFVAAQVYTGETTDSPRLRLAVCDNGTGVLAHLRRNPRWEFLSRDDQALDVALRRKVSGVSNERGNGLADLVSTAQRHGELHLNLRSGYGEVVVDGRRGRRQVNAREEYVQGTWAWLTHQASV